MPQAFAWYTVDVAYDVAAGRYDLVIRAEGREAPLVSLRSQPNAASQPGSAVDKFSFVGSPFADRSSVVYYVDDVVIGSDESVTRLPFAAPGPAQAVHRPVRRVPAAAARAAALPAGASGPTDFGFEADDLAQLAAAGFSESLQRLLEGAPGAPAPRVSTEQGPEHWRRVLDAASRWSEGCAALDRGDARLAHARFTGAADEVPEGRLFRSRPRWRSPR